MAEREYTITLTLCDGDFEMSMGRMPRDDEEFEEWAYLLEKGLLNGHIDWDILYECVREAMPKDANRAVSRSSTKEHRKPKAGLSGDAP